MSRYPKFLRCLIVTSGITFVGILSFQHVASEDKGHSKETAFLTEAEPTKDLSLQDSTKTPEESSEVKVQSKVLSKKLTGIKKRATPPLKKVKESTDIQNDQSTNGLKKKKKSPEQAKKKTTEKKTDKPKKKTAPKKEKKKKEKKKKEKKPPVLINTIIVAETEEAMNVLCGLDQRGVHFLNFYAPGGFDLLQTYLAPYIGQPMNKENLKALKKDVVGYYKYFEKTGYAIVIPKQKDIPGTVKILVKPKIIKTITYTGSQWWSKQEIEKIFNVQPGPLNEDSLKNNLEWLNRNPFHTSKLKFNKGTEPEDINLEVITKDRYPLKFFVGADNTGTPTTGLGRLYTGGTWGNVFSQNDVFSYKLTTSNIPKRLASNSMNYTKFLPWKHYVSIFGNYSVVNPSVPKRQITLRANQVKFRYFMPLLPLYAARKQELGFGVDIKYTNSNALDLSGNSVDVLTGPIVIKKLQIFQIVGNYYATHKTKRNSFKFDFKVFVSPGNVLHSQSNALFEANRAFSRNKYGYGYLQIQDIFKLSDKFTLAVLFRGQAATKTLPSTELLTIGGASTVRGYRQSEFSGDEGVILNLELRLKPYNPLTAMGWFPGLKDRLIFLGFLDYGLASNIKLKAPNPGKPKPIATQYAISMGPGVRYYINKNLSLRCDYGFKLHTMRSITAKQKLAHSGSGAWCVGLTLKY